MLMSLHCFHFDCADGSLSVLFGIDCLAVFDVLDAKRLNLLCKLTLFSGPLDCLSSARWIAVRPPPREIIKTHKATTSFRYCCVSSNAIQSIASCKGVRIMLMGFL